MEKNDYRNPVKADRFKNKRKKYYENFNFK